MPDATAPAAVPPQEEVPSGAAILRIALAPEARGLRHRLASAVCRISYRARRIRRKILWSPSVLARPAAIWVQRPAAEPRFQPETSTLLAR